MFSAFGHPRDQPGAGYACLLQAISCASWASPASTLKTPRPRGKAPRYDYSQRACGPSDTSEGNIVRSIRSGLFCKFIILGVDNRVGSWYHITCRQATWCHGSVGRAHRSHRWGRRFESYWHHSYKKSPLVGGFFVCLPNSIRICGTLRWERTSMGRFSLRRQWRKQQGKTLLDRAQRDRRFESYWHHQLNPHVLIQSMGISFCIYRLINRQNTGYNYQIWAIDARNELLGVILSNSGSRSPSLFSLHMTVFRDRNQRFIMECTLLWTIAGYRPQCEVSSKVS